MASKFLLLVMRVSAVWARGGATSGRELGVIHSMADINRFYRLSSLIYYLLFAYMDAYYNFKVCGCG
jgi:hypothetical protein